jgi:SAM-dependent methyltransferase
MSGNVNKGSRPCAVCGEDRPEMFKIWFDGYVKVYRCLQCGFISQFPGPGSDTIITDYEDYYSLSFLERNQEFMYPQRRRVMEDIIDRIRKIKPGGDILDIGCGDGHFLYLCERRGFRCYGVENSKNLSEYASTKSNAKITQGLYSREMFEEGSFDVISLIQVLEHIPEPKEMLESIRYHLRPGGVVVVEIPSIKAPHFLAYRMTKIKKFVAPPDGVIDSHFGYFSPKTLLSLTERCGFETVSIVTGRWRHKYSGYLKALGAVVDPFLNLAKIGGILYIGSSRR